jgi:hypothetical protein
LVGKQSVISDKIEKYKKATWYGIEPRTSILHYHNLPLHHYIVCVN